MFQGSIPPISTTSRQAFWLAVFFIKIRLRFYRLPLLQPTKPIGFCGNPIAPCGAFPYAIFFTITFNIRLICSLVNALTTLHCRYHFFASSPSSYFIFYKNTASLLSAAALLFRKTYWVLRKYFAPCGALSYTIFKHYSKKCDTQNHAPHFSIHCSYYLIRYIIVIYLKSLSSRFKPFSIYPSRLPLILSAFAIARATDGFPL